MPALILDCDGVLAETERDGHLPAFNQTFREFGLPLEWSEDEYGEKLKIGGGKERMASSLTPEILVQQGAGDDAGRTDLLRRLHARKTELFQERVKAGLLPTRPGIRRTIMAALERGWTVAVASTSAEPSVRAVLEHAVGTEAAGRCHVFAGDIVDRKKPAPDIYLKVLRDLELEPEHCIVIEDSGIGCRAAVEAGLTTVVTTSHYTHDDDFSGAARVLDDLGDDTGDGRQVLLADLETLLDRER